MSFKKRHLHKVLHSFPRPTAKPIQVTIRFNKMGYNRRFQMKVSHSLPVSFQSFGLPITGEAQRAALLTSSLPTSP